MTLFLNRLFFIKKKLHIRTKKYLAIEKIVLSEYYKIYERNISQSEKLWSISSILWFKLKEK